MHLLKPIFNEMTSKYNIKLINIITICILIISIFFLFFNYKHTYNYGDQAIENIMATSQLDQILKKYMDIGQIKKITEFTLWTHL